MKKFAKRETEMETQSKTTENALKLLGEYFAPGASLLMDGKILPGTAHLIAGLLLRSAIGPIGYGLVIANSYSSSTTSKSLLRHFIKEKAEPAEEKAEPAEGKSTEEVVEPAAAS
jgi:hypothetical protein